MSQLIETPEMAALEDPQFRNLGRVLNIEWLDKLVSTFSRMSAPIGVTLNPFEQPGIRYLKAASIERVAKLEKGRMRGVTSTQEVHDRILSSGQLDKKLSAQPVGLTFLGINIDGGGLSIEVEDRVSPAGKYYQVRREKSISQIMTFGGGRGRDNTKKYHMLGIGDIEQPEGDPVDFYGIFVRRLFESVSAEVPFEPMGEM